MRLVTFILAATLAGASAAWADQPVPDYDTMPSCRGAAPNAAPKALSAARDREGCLRGEQQARTTLVQKWGDFTAPQKARCVRLSSLGGLPSYVELLTCLELAQAADKLPDDPGSHDRVAR